MASLLTEQVTQLKAKLVHSVYITNLYNAGYFIFMEKLLAVERTASLMHNDQ
jgi:hypothetical protein